MKKIKEKFFKRNNKRGFSILEVLIALFVLTVGVVGMLAMITNSVRSSSDSRDVMIASQLSQEGIELIRWVRDNSSESVASSFSEFDSYLARGCRIDASMAIAMLAAGNMSCSAAGDMTAAQYLLYYNESVVAGYWTYNHTASGTASKFSRKIVITNSGTNERLVKSFVYWGTGWATPPNSSGANCYEANKCVYTEGKLTNWED